ncbi:MAG: RdgB/HAM1 family non-canonical purine NTP pyrophosphatase [Planctomycetes bacterium]|nr:RdgB/HAM1 family non-canonical purine NTP pyrophosphatase [Planctomycetota bacterium]MCB9888068.1 RdgB/HAM1 family non-canonical purine NTP pyrophosphatase [Planctomycetota bacterium]
MPELWVATGNAKKRVELERLLQPLGISLRLQSEAPQAVEVVEDCPDFAGNAAKKARALAAVVGAPAVADDSGLCVDALGGRPGVLSARYAGPDASDADRVAKLLAELRDTPDAARTARFVCSVCLVGSDGRICAAFEETCEGVIGIRPSGAGGFGYDPVFVAQPHVSTTTTFAELTAEQKDAISHRGKALRRLRSWLQAHDLT